METSTSAEGAKKPPTAGGGDEDLSMEEILQSIRKIIADDDKKPGEEVVPGSDVLELTEMIEDDGSIATLPAEPPSDILEQIDAALVAHQASPAEPTPAMDVPMDSLLSDQAAIAANAAFKKLQAAEPETPLRTTPIAGFRSGASVEDMVEDLLRPMLKTWLDANLPAIVERIVEREIKKLTRV